jgi:hypothetical protein
MSSFIIPAHDPREFSGDGGLAQLNADAQFGRDCCPFSIPALAPAPPLLEKPVPLEKVALSRSRHVIGFNAHVGRDLYGKYLIELGLLRQQRAELNAKLVSFQKVSAPVDDDPEMVFERLEAMRAQAMRENRENEDSSW